MQHVQMRRLVPRASKTLIPATSLHIRSWCCTWYAAMAPVATCRAVWPFALHMGPSLARPRLVWTRLLAVCSFLTRTFLRTGGRGAGAEHGHAVQLSPCCGAAEFVVLGSTPVTRAVFDLSSWRFVRSGLLEARRGRRRQDLRRRRRLKRSGRGVATCGCAYAETVFRA